MNASSSFSLDVRPLYKGGEPVNAVTKVGIIPFILPQPVAQPRVMLMKPRAEAKNLGPPAFQIAKGTRRIHINERWCDMREDDLIYADECFHEPLLATALREGREEIGLKESNILRLFDMGCFSFISASRGLPKPLRLYAAEVKDEHDFLDHETTTHEKRFMTLEESMTLGRADHVEILREVLQLLKPILKD